jgi:hypothetical protein
MVDASSSRSVAASQDSFLRGGGREGGEGHIRVVRMRRRVEGMNDVGGGVRGGGMYFGRLSAVRT